MPTAPHSRPMVIRHGDCAGLQDLLYSKATQWDELQQHLKRTPNKSSSGSNRFSSSSLSTW